MKEIDKIFKADQEDRKNSEFFKKRKFFANRDAKRKTQVKELIKKDQLITGKDWYQATMIFHHSDNIKDLNLALSLVKKSFDKKYEKAKWLFAAVTDRILMKENKPQKFGTQFFRKNNNSPWVLYKINPKITNKERKEYNAPTIRQMEKLVKKLNQQK